MELKSLSYVAFALAVVALYYGVRKVKNGQRCVLLAANLFFILATSGLKSLLIITLCVAISYGAGLLIEKNILLEQKSKARRIFWLDIVLSLAILCYFKFFKDTFLLLQDLLRSKGICVNALVSPIGLSYFTLTMIAYANDIYHKKHKAERNFLDYFLFITYFPSIVQGPVNLYKRTAPQFKLTHQPEGKRIIMGMQRSLWGYFKKVVIADRIGILVMAILKDEAAGVFLLFWAMVLYSFQIYADFSGGIDVIMGLSEMLDIRLAENFRSPLVSRSVTEYWQRWHMSLGEFMEKYLYYPIVLNRSVMKFSKKIPNKYLKKVFSATLASVIVFILVGVWHGTGWNYVVYGCYQAFFVSTAVLLGPWYKKVRTALHINENALSWKLFQALRTFLILTFGRFFIRAKDLPQAFSLMARTFRNFSLRQTAILFDGTLCGYGLDYKNIHLMYLGIALLIAVDILHERKVKLRETVLRQDIVTRFAIYLLAVFAIIIFGIYGPEFSASSFIYQEF